MLEYLGKFHPLLLHLPIGMLALALVFKLMSLREEWRTLERVLPLVLLLSFLAAVGTCVTGYLLSLSGEYGAELVDRHQWAGIALTVLCGGLFVGEKWGLPRALELTAWAGLAVLLTLTGHWGGSLTHGEDFLAFPSSEPERPVIADLDQARVYHDLVAPVLEQKCYACHSSRKQKGKLRLDEVASIQRGGEGGRVLLAGDTEGSELYQRLLLPELDEYHMPPKGRPQLREEEIALIEWWIASGASFEATLAQTEGQAAIRPTLEKLVAVESTSTYLPEAEVSPAPVAVLDSLHASGVVVLPVGEGSPFLSANFLEIIVTDTLLHLLRQLQPQLVWLKMGHTGLTDAQLDSLAGFPHLALLHLEGNPITDAGLPALAQVPALQRLNLAGTEVTAEGLEALASLEKLAQVYLFEAAVTPADLAALRKQLPGVSFDLGGYAQLFEAVEARVDSVGEGGD